MPVQKQSISLPPDLVAEMQGRGDSLSGAISRHLGRYLEGMRRERAMLRGLLSDAEVSLILDALNGVAMLDEHSPSWIVHEVSDAVKIDALDRKWGVDGPALVRKLSGLDYPANCALADAADRWWQRIGEGEDPEASGALA